MSVIVTMTAGPDGVNEITHPWAAWFEVEAGYARIFDDGDDEVAVHAPGTWLCVRNGEKKEAKS